MIALCVDDEALLLEDLKRAVEKSPDISQVYAFDDAIDADEWAQTHKADIAFLDVRMPVVDGLELARRLHRSQPGLPIVFCTGYKEYALEAFTVHASGYLLKPVRPDKVQDEIEHVKHSQDQTEAVTSEEKNRTAQDQKQETPKADYLLTVQPYGGFAVLDRRGEPIRFKRKKEKELFAALIHQNGKEITADQLCEMLWDDNAWMYEKNKQYIYTLLSLLRGTMRDAGAEEILKKGESGYILDTSRIYIDDSGIKEQEYMPGYAWSK
jgi:two-component SAPR family response regulator